MKTGFRETFTKDLRHLRQPEIRARVKQVIEAIERAAGLAEIPQLRKLQAPGAFYRIRMGDYRLGLIVEGDQATLVRILHRREIYRFFP
ncbi:MAG TPA: type II toxin-antitoxin system RelE/ParE family toxin [Thermoanaerobaculia bacterium]|nr:type II toxin-antitoxin system RelE/ParE family toxin [Thermoanaerobaculia bacterium]